MDKLGKDIECEKKVKMKDVLTRTQILSFPGYLINFTPGKIPPWSEPGAPDRGQKTADDEFDIFLIKYIQIMIM